MATTNADSSENVLESMPYLLRLTTIAKTIEYIFSNDFPYELIRKHRLGDQFYLYLRTDINVAMRMIDTTVDGFIEKYYEHCIIICKDPEGYLIQAKPRDSNQWEDWDKFESQPIIQAIENAPQFLLNSEPIISEPNDTTDNESLTGTNDENSDVKSNLSYTDFESSGANSTSDYVTPWASPTSELEAGTPLAEIPSNDTFVPEDLTDNEFDYNEQSVDNSSCSANPSDVDELDIDLNSCQRPQETNGTNQQKESIIKNLESKKDKKQKVQVKVPEPPKKEEPKKEKSKTPEPVKKEDPKKDASKKEKSKTPEPVKEKIEKKEENQKLKAKTPEPAKKDEPKKTGSNKNPEPTKKSPTPESNVKFALSFENSASKFDMDDDLLSKATILPVKKKNNDEILDCLDTTSIPSAKGNKSTTSSKKLSSASTTVKKTEIKPGKVEKSNVPNISNDEMSFMLEAAMVTRQRRSTSSTKDSAATSLSNLSVLSTKNEKKSFRHVDYDMDSTTFEITNYQDAAKVKFHIANSVDPVPMSHLLNSWKFRQFYCFNELVLLFQYIYPFTLTEDFDINAYQGLLSMAMEHEDIFRGVEKLARSVELMFEMHFLYFDETTDVDIIRINQEILNLPMIPLAKGMPSLLMYCLAIKSSTKTQTVTVNEFFGQFQDISENEFCNALVDCLNRRPDLFLLEKDNSNILWNMRIKKNPKIYQAFVCYDYILRDLRRAKDLHLRQDYIDSVSQFEYIY